VIGVVNAINKHGPAGVDGQTVVGVPFSVHDEKLFSTICGLISVAMWIPIMQDERALANERESSWLSTVPSIFTTSFKENLTAIVSGLLIQAGMHTQAEFVNVAVLSDGNLLSLDPEVKMNITMNDQFHPLVQAFSTGIGTFAVFNQLDKQRSDGLTHPDVLPRNLLCASVFATPAAHKPCAILYVVNKNGRHDFDHKDSLVICNSAIVLGTLMSRLNMEGGAVPRNELSPEALQAFLGSMDMQARRSSNDASPPLTNRTPAATKRYTLFDLEMQSIREPLQNHSPNDLWLLDGRLSKGNFNEEKYKRGRLQVGEDLPPSFMTFEANVLPFPIDTLLCYIVTMFRHFDLCNRFKIPLNTLCHFVGIVSCNYRANFYHNFHHGVDVLQSCFAALVQGKARDLLTDLDVLTLLVASLCHDIDHPGVNNMYLTNSKHRLAIVYRYPLSYLLTCFCVFNFLIFLIFLIFFNFFFF
jgi:hypothetical protein